MTTPTHADPTLCTKPITLWVEDRLTREYLLRVWASDTAIFDIRIAGSHDTVVAVVRDYQQQGIDKVFGFCDRDFRDCNQGSWMSNQALRVFRPEVFEVENFLLDWDALSGCSMLSAGITPARIERILQTGPLH